MFPLTRWSVAGLRVATFHCGRPKVGGALLLRVQVPIQVRASHLSIPRARAAATRALEEENTHERATSGHKLLASPCCPAPSAVWRHSPVATRRRASWSAADRRPSGRFG